MQQQIERAKEQVVVASYMNHTARAPANFPSEEALKQTYEANKTSLIAPAQYRVAQIYLPHDKESAEIERRA